MVLGTVCTTAYEVYHSVCKSSCNSYIFINKLSGIGPFVIEDVISHLIFLECKPGSFGREIIVGLAHGFFLTTKAIVNF